MSNQQPQQQPNSVANRKRRAESDLRDDEQKEEDAVAVAARVMIRVGQKRRRGITGKRNVMAEGFLNVDVTYKPSSAAETARMVNQTTGKALFGRKIVKDDARPNSVYVFPN